METIVELRKIDSYLPFLLHGFPGQNQRADKERKFSYNCSGSVFINTQIVYIIPVLKIITTFDWLKPRA